MTDQQNMQMVAIIVLDEVRKTPDASPAVLYARCLARGVDLQLNGQPLERSPYRTPESRPRVPEQTAYLCMEHRMGPGRIPMFRGFRIYSSEPWHLSGQSSALFHTIYFQLSRPTYAEAQDEILSLCRDFPTFKWIWPYVDPSREAHQARFDREIELDRIADTFATQR